MFTLERKDFMVELEYSSANDWRLDFSLNGRNRFDDGEFMKRYQNTLCFPECEIEEEYYNKLNIIKLVDCLDEIGYYIHQLEPDYQETFSKLVVSYLMYEIPDVTDVPEWREELKIE